MPLLSANVSENQHVTLLICLICVKTFNTYVMSISARSACIPRQMSNKTKRKHGTHHTIDALLIAKPG